MKKIIILSLFLASLTGVLLFTPASQAGPTVYVNLGPYGSVGYPSGYVYPVNNGCCNGCAYPNPVYYNNPYSYNNAPLYNPYLFDTVNSPWASNAGRIVPTRMNPRGPYAY